ncbi:MAG TPA: MMPL family transporter [bacterium]|nr:MMPL family transporter [bacterium]
MLNKIITWYVNFSARFTTVLFVIFIILFGLSIYFVKNNFVVDSDLAAMFDGKNENVKRLKTVTERIGTFETFLVVAKSDSFDKNLKFMEELSEKIKVLKEVSSVELKKDTEYIEKHALLYIPLEDLKENQKLIQKKIASQVESALSLESDKTTEKTKDSELKDTIASIKKKASERKKKFDLSPYFTTDDGNYLALKVRPSGKDTDAKNLTKAMTAIQSKIDEIQPAHPGVQAEIGGELLHKVKEVKSLNKGLLFSTAACVILLSLIIMWFFRSFAAFFIVILPLSVGILAAIAVTILLIGVFNIVSAFSFTVLYGLGIDFGIHLLSRYGEKKQTEPDPHKCMEITCIDTFPSIISGALTTAVAFLTIYFIDFKGFSDYGLVAFIGIVTSLFAFFLFFPVFVLLLEKTGKLKVNARKITILETTYHFFYLHKKTVLIISGIITALSLVALVEIPFEYDLKKLSYKVDESYENSIVKQYETKIVSEKRDTRSRGRAAIYLTESREDAAVVTDILRDMQKSGTDGGRIEGFYSLSTFIPTDSEEKLKIIKSMKRTIERKIAILSDDDRNLVEKELMPYLSVDTPVEEELLPDWIKKLLSEKDGTLGKFVIVMISGNYKDMKEVSEIKNTLGTLEKDGKEYLLSSPFLLLADVDEVIHKDVPILSFFSLLVVFITLLIMFRSLRHSIFLSIPLLASILWMFGAAFVFDVKLNLFNMIIVPTMLGTGIDSSIHIFDRFIKSGFDRSAIPEILNHTGGAVLFSSITTLVGFMSLVFSSHNGMISIGVIASLGIAMATIVNLTVFPLVMEKGKKK